MEVHSTLRFACLAVVLAVGLAGMTYGTKAGGLKAGANTASLGAPRSVAPTKLSRYSPLSSPRKRGPVRRSDAIVTT